MTPEKSGRSLQQQLRSLIERDSFIAGFAIATRGIEIGRVLLVEEGKIVDKTKYGETVFSDWDFRVRLNVVGQMTPEKRSIFYAALHRARDLYHGIETGRFPDYPL